MSIRDKATTGALPLIALSVLWAMPVLADGGRTTTFSVPGAAYTSANHINAGGAIAGNYETSGNGYGGGFIRTLDGSIYTFGGDGEGWDTAGINREGVVVGDYRDDNFTQHGFIRTPKGKITTFDPAGSVETTVVGVDDKGATAGTYEDSAAIYHGFVRASDGAIASFDVPQSTTTEALAMNARGDIAGSWFDSSGAHGFLRLANGKFQTFDVAGAETGTAPSAISDDDTIAGTYVDANYVQHGYLRYADGTIESFDVRGNDGLNVSGINRAGVVVGTYYLRHTDVVPHAFLRTAHGRVVTLDQPHKRWMYGKDINVQGWTIGEFCKPNVSCKGFVRER